MPVSGLHSGAMLWLMVEFPGYVPFASCPVDTVASPPGLAGCASRAAGRRRRISLRGWLVPPARRWRAWSPRRADPCPGCRSGCDALPAVPVRGPGRSRILCFGLACPRAAPVLCRLASLACLPSSALLRASRHLFCCTLCVASLFHLGASLSLAPARLLPPVTAFPLPGPCAPRKCVHYAGEQPLRLVPLISLVLEKPVLLTPCGRTGEAALFRRRRGSRLQSPSHRTCSPRAPNKCFRRAVRSGPAVGWPVSVTGRAESRASRRGGLKVLLFAVG